MTEARNQKRGALLGIVGLTLLTPSSVPAQPLTTFKGHTEYVASVCFSPDGRRIASGSRDETVRVWDAATGKEILTLRGHTDGVTSVCFSFDGKRLASGSRDRTAKVWDAQTGQDLL